MKKIIISVFIALTLCVAGFCEERPAVTGWNGAEWGMDKTQIKGVFENAEILTDRKQGGALYDGLKISDYEINGKKYSVIFEMDAKTDKLKLVRLIHKPCLESMFGEIKSILSSKYGQPLSDEKSRMMGDYHKSARWKPPQTDIELVYHYNKYFGGVVNIIYTEAAEIDTNKF